MEGVAGDTLMDCRVADVMFSGTAGLVIPPREAVMFAVPPNNPSAIPEAGLIVAIAGLEEDQETACVMS